jgi:two-component sensor histidine kinase
MKHYNVIVRLLLVTFFAILVLSLPAQRFIPDQDTERIYRHISTKNGLISNKIYRICQDSKGFIWISTEAGVSRFDGLQFRNFPVGEIGYKDILTIFCDAQDRIWIAGFNNAVSYYDRSTDRFVRLGDVSAYFTPGKTTYLPPEFENGPNQSTLIRLFRKDQVLQFTADKKVVPYTYPRPLNGALFPAQTMLDSQEIATWLRDHQTKLPDGKPHVYLDGFALESGLVVRNLGKCYLYNRASPVRPVQIGAEDVPAFILPAGEQAFFYGPYGKGVRRIHTNGASTTFLPDKHVNYVFEDKQHNLWFSTNNEGIYLLSSDMVLLPPPSGKVMLLAGDNQENVVAGLDNGQLWRIKNDKLERLPYPHQGHLRKMAFSPEGRLWRITDKRIYADARLVKEMNCIKDFDFPANPDESIAVATCAGCYWLTDQKNLTKSFFQQRASAISSPADQTDQCWIGTPTALMLVSKTDGPLLSVPGLGITCLQRAQDGSIWGGLEDGRLLRIHQNTICLFPLVPGRHSLLPPIPLSRSTVLPPPHNYSSSHFIHQVFVDKQGAVWVSTSNGLYELVVNKHQYTTRYYSVINGLPSNDINAIYAYQDRIYAATEEGICMFNKNQITKGSPPDAFITHVNGIREPGPQQVIELPYQAKVDIEFTGIFFAGNPPWNRVQFVVTLNGIPLDTSENRSKRFENLPPGQYEFQVSAIAGNGPGSAPATVKFAIHRPFWLQWWFGFMVAALVVVSTFLLVRRQQRKITQENRIARQMAELELKAIRLQMNPHFIFNCLNSIQLFYLKGEMEAAQQYMGAFSALIRMTLNLSRKNFISLEEEIQYLETYLGLEKMRFGSRLDFQIMHDPQLPPAATELPPLLLQPYVENAIKHGIAPLKDRTGVVTVSFESTNDGFCCRIRDNGIGFTEKRPANNQQHHSVGMLIGSERAALLNSIYGNYLLIEVKNLGDTTESSGTQVTLFFKKIFDAG